MSSISLVCRPTTDTFVRFLIILVALWGFALYFFYDGSVGYRNKNAAYFAFQAFAEGGRKASELSSEQWQSQYAGKALYDTIPDAQRSASELSIVLGGKSHPMPAERMLDATPAEFLDHARMKAGWNEAWQSYSSTMRYPLKPSDKPYDQATVNEQWYAGAVCILLGCVVLYFIIRTARRVLAIDGRDVRAVGQQFRIEDISKIDLRQWGPGFKGVAYFTVKGKRLKIDGMTYGGFGSKNDAPAERFMQMLLSQYSGEIIEYAQESDTQSDQTKDQ